MTTHPGASFVSPAKPEIRAETPVQPLGAALKKYCFPYTATATFLQQTDTEILRKQMNRKLGGR